MYKWPEFKEKNSFLQKTQNPILLYVFHLKNSIFNQEHSNRWYGKEVSPPPPKAFCLLANQKFDGKNLTLVGKKTWLYSYFFVKNKNNF